MRKAIGLVKYNRKTTATTKETSVLYTRHQLHANMNCLDLIEIAIRFMSQAFFFFCINVFLFFFVWFGGVYYIHDVLMLLIPYFFHTFVVVVVSLAIVIIWFVVFGTANCSSIYLITLLKIVIVAHLLLCAFCRTPQHNLGQFFLMSSFNRFPLFFFVCVGFYKISYGIDGNIASMAVWVSIY